MKLRISKTDNELELKMVELDENNNESLVAFDYIKYINCYLNGDAVFFEYSEDIDDDIKEKVKKIDLEIKELISKANDNTGESSAQWLYRYTRSLKWKKKKR